MFALIYVTRPRPHVEVAQVTNYIPAQVTGSSNPHDLLVRWLEAFGPFLNECLPFLGGIGLNKLERC
jgi:hypothetical protein